MIIVGGGVAGASTAFYAAKEGIDVLMLEKDQFPRDKPCGDGIVSNAMPIIEEMGFMDWFRENSYGTEWAYFYAHTGEYVGNNMVNTTGDKLYACRRILFDHQVNLAARKQGIDYLENFEVTDVIMKRGQAIGVKGIHNGQLVEAYADIIVLAAGSHCMAARKLGFWEEDPTLVYYGCRSYWKGLKNIRGVEFFYPKHFLPSGYIWFFPMGPDTANVGVFISEASLAKTGKTTEELFWDWAKNTPEGKERITEDAEMTGQWKGWRLPCAMQKPVYGPGLMAVGDSGNMIEQFGGEGIPQALIAGKMAAMAAKKAFDENDFSAECLEYYQELCNENILPTIEGNKYFQDLCFGTVENMVNMIRYCNEVNEDGEPRCLTDYMMYRMETMGDDTEVDLMYKDANASDIDVTKIHGHGF